MKNIYEIKLFFGKINKKNDRKFNLYLIFLPEAIWYQLQVLNLHSSHVLLFENYTSSKKLNCTRNQFD